MGVMGPTGQWVPQGRPETLPGAHVYYDSGIAVLVAQDVPHGLLVEHWCTLTESWNATQIPKHTVPEHEGYEDLTIVGSLYWPDCCGKHGWLLDGTWKEA